MKLCAIIPSCNHYLALPAIIKKLSMLNMPILIIDDGSIEPAAAALAALHNKAAHVTVVRLPINQGKGAAMIKGFRMAIASGFSHALQIDADGQHDLEMVKPMLTLAEAYPEALISGQAVYDSTAPRSRRIGRWLTHVWVWIETISCQITDSMTGFRVYPLAAVAELLEKGPLGKRMEFDTDIMVRLFWAGVPPLMVPVKVIYPPNNLSNFDLVQDNIRIIKSHAVRVVELAKNIITILENRPIPIEVAATSTVEPLQKATVSKVKVLPDAMPAQHWSKLAERGAAWGLEICMKAYNIFGRDGCRIALMPIVLYFYLTESTQRMASYNFLSRVRQRPPSFQEGFQHFMNFAMRALDAVIAWSGGFRSSLLKQTDPESFQALKNDPRGSMIIVSHTGNMELARALLDEKTRARMTLLVHTHHAINYNTMLKKINPASANNMIEVTEMSPATIIDLQQRIEKGGWIAIAGDRVSVLGEGSSVPASFLGEDADFAKGPWVLAALLNCPVYLLFCFQDDGVPADEDQDETQVASSGPKYRLTIEHFADQIVLPREKRTESIQEYVSRYASRLEHFAKIAPLQWYNFFDFWGQR